MKVRSESRRVCDKLDDLRRAVHRLQRADPKEHLVGPGGKNGHERLQRALAAIASVRTEVDAGDRNLLVASGDGTFDIANHILEQTGAADTSGFRDDAVAAVFVASSLHAQRERRSAGKAGDKRGAARAVAVDEAF